MSLRFGKVSESTWVSAVAVQITVQLQVCENRIQRDTVSVMISDETALRSCPITDGIAVMVHRSVVSD